MNKLALVIALVLSIFVAACTAQPRRLDLPASEIAELRCRDYGMGLVPLGLHAKLGFETVDSETLRTSGWTGAPRIIEVAAGAHIVEVSYLYWIDGTPQPGGRERIELEVAAGEVVEFDLELASGGARVTHARVTAK